MPDVPFYQDWTFWQWVVSLTALVAALIPPLIRLWKGPKLDLETHDRIQVTHTAGNPNISLFVILRNVGGRPLRVRSIDLEIRPSGSETFLIPGKSYFPLPAENTQAILAPFKLAPDEDWSHVILFFNPFSRKDETTFRHLVSNLRSDLVAKKALPGNAEVVVEAEPAVVQPVIEFFNSKFRWHSGEYEVNVTVHTDPDRATVSKRLRMTLFESDSNELRAYTDAYRYGMGVVFFDHDKQPGVGIPLLNA
ncbi:MAG: hypothetical protein HY067_08285 [Betaproteobacteria bacterium]|nr:hypothetical protein [Betaproteobacteria bacterium]